MYSYEDRMKAVQLYIQYDQNAAAVIRELGYPNRHSLVSWYKEYLNNNDLKKKRFRPEKYSKAQQDTAVRYYMEHGKCASRTLRALGYPSRTLLKQWIKERHPEEKSRCYSARPMVYLTKEKKESAVLELCQRDKTVDEIASQYNVRRESVYLWARKLLGKGSVSSVPKRKKDTSLTPNTVEELQATIDSLKKQAKELEDEVFRLRVEKDVIEKAAEVIKKDQGVSLSSLTNHEKAIVIDALRSQYSLKLLLGVLHMSKSSYFYQEVAMSAPDKYAEVRGKIKQAFDESSNRYGYRRIHAVLKNESVTISEKVVRRLMKKEGLIVKSVKKRKYNSELPVNIILS